MTADKVLALAEELYGLAQDERASFIGELADMAPAGGEPRVVGPSPLLR